jgi:hypothetical protein
VTSCVSPSGNCERAEFWEGEFEPQLDYAIALNSVFEYDENDRATENELVAHRVHYLEKYCFQTRVK